MQRRILILFALSATAMLSACGGTTDNKAPNVNANSNANTNANTAKPVAAAPTSEALFAMDCDAVYKVSRWGRAAMGRARCAGLVKCTRT